MIIYDLLTPIEDSKLRENELPKSVRAERNSHQDHITRKTANLHKYELRLSPTFPSNHTSIDDRIAHLPDIYESSCTCIHSATTHQSTVIAIVRQHKISRHDLTWSLERTKFPTRSSSSPVTKGTESTR